MTITPSPAYLAAQRRRTGWSLVRWGLGFGLIFGLILALGIFLTTGASQALSQYESAPTCAEAGAPPAGCRLEAAAEISRVDYSSRKYAIVYFTLVPAGGVYSGRFAYPAPREGASVEVEVWHGMVTLVDGKQTLDNPALDPNLKAGWVVILFSVIVLGWLATAAAGAYMILTPRRA